MPIVNVIRKGITPAVRKVPTSTCATVVPMTMNRVGKELKSEKEDPTKVESLADAFEKFRPSLDFVGQAGEEEAEFRAALRFRSVKDFDPESLQKLQEYKVCGCGIKFDSPVDLQKHIEEDKKCSLSDAKTDYHRNDLAGLKNNIDLLYRLKKRWALPTVRRAWANAEQRKEIIAALSRLRTEVARIAAKGGNA